MLPLYTTDGKKLYESAASSWLACVHHAQRDGVALDYVDLSYRDLVDVNFDRCSLTHASFIGSNLQRARFYRANLYGANLQSVNAANAKFGESSLFMASCRHCVFDDASLHGADCRRTDFSFASFERAALYTALFVEADFTQAHVATARSWSAVQFFDGQLQHYRDDLWLLLYQYPGLAGLLLTPLARAERHADMVSAQLAALPGLAQSLLATIGRHEDVERAVAQRYWACHWFRQFSSQREANVLEALGNLAWLCVEAAPGTISTHVFGAPNMQYYHISRWFEQFRQPDWPVELLESALQSTLLWLRMEANTDGGSIAGNTPAGGIAGNTPAGVQTPPQARRLRITGKEG